MLEIITFINQLLLAGAGYFIWELQRRSQRRQELEDKLREDRLRIYYDVVEPFIMRLKPETASREGPDDDGKQQKSLGSDEYRWTAFRLALIGSDGVIKAYNDLFQHLYHGKEADLAGVRYASLLGRLLLEIRKSMGNEATEIDNWEMLEWLIIEARTLRELDPLRRSSASVGRGRKGFLRHWAGKPPRSTKD